MSVLKGKELRIVGFLCNWCSYGGADTAGVGRFAQPTDLRIIRVPCSGRIDPLFVAKTLLDGADGVLVSGCHPRDCHYSQGNFYARRRLEVLKRFLPVLGIDPARFEYTWVSASEGPRWQKVVTSFTERIHSLGPALRHEDADLSLGGAAAERLSAAASGHRPHLPAVRGNGAGLETLKERIREELPNVECVIGWQHGYDPLHHAPLFIRSPEDVENLVWGPLNVHNPATYLTAFRNRKVGVVVKGCDSRSVVELLQEKLIVRDQVVVLGMPCSGVVDVTRVLQSLRRLGIAPDRIDAVEAEGETLTVMVEGVSHSMAMADVAAQKCLQCRFPNAVLADSFVGDPISPVLPNGRAPAAPTLLDTLSIRERMAFWRYHMERCIRCHACRNVCPLCVCKDHCIAQSRDPHWISQEDTVTEKLLFQAVHAVHLAGRCTECGECERACPNEHPRGGVQAPHEPSGPGSLRLPGRDRSGGGAAASDIQDGRRSYQGGRLTHDLCQISSRPESPGLAHGPESRIQGPGADGGRRKRGFQTL